MYKGLTKEQRKACPVYEGVLKYFPLAMLYTALVSKIGNDQHNPGEKLRWAREKSTDHKDCLARHLTDSSFHPRDDDKLMHIGKVAWRALAELQTVLEAYDEAYGEGIGPLIQEALDKQQKPETPETVYDPGFGPSPEQVFELLRTHRPLTEGEHIQKEDVFWCGLSDKFTPATAIGNKWNAEDYWPCYRPLMGIRLEVADRPE